MPPIRGPIGVKPKKPKVPKNTSVLPRLTPHPTTGPAAKSSGDIKSAADLHRASAYQHQQARHIALAQTHDTKSNKEFQPAHRIEAQHKKEHKQLVNLARRIIALHQASESHPGMDVKSNLDLITAEAFKLTPQYEHDFTQSALAHAEYQKEKDSAAQGKKPGGLISGFIHGEGPIISAANKAANIAGVAGRDTFKLAHATLNPASALAEAVIPGADKPGKFVEGLASNVGREAIEIPANFIPSTYFLAEPLVHGRFEKTAKRLIQGVPHTPAQVYRHPLSTALILTGVGRGLSRGAGRIERSIPHRVVKTEPDKVTYTTKFSGDDKDLAAMRKQLEKVPYGHPLRNDLEAQIALSESELYHLKKGAGKPIPRKLSGREHLAQERVAQFEEALQRNSQKLNDLRNREATYEGATLAGSVLRDRIKELEGHIDAIRQSRDDAIKDWRAVRENEPQTPVDLIKEKNRVSGKTTISYEKRPYQHLERPYPGLAIKQVIPANKGFVGYRVQKFLERRKAVKQGGYVRMPNRAVRYRVDQQVYKETNMAREAAQAKLKQGRKEGLPEEQARKESIAVFQQVREYNRRNTIYDFAMREKGGKGPVRVFYDDKADPVKRKLIKEGKLEGKSATENAKAFAESWNKKQQSLGRTDLKPMVPVHLPEDEFGPSEVVLIPRSAKHRLDLHDDYLKNTLPEHVGAALTGAFRRAVLPFSLKWMNANIVEGSLRSGISGGALPKSIMAGKELHSFLENLTPEGKTSEPYSIFRSIASGGGHGQMQRDLLVEEGMNSWERKLSESDAEDFGRQLTQWGRNPNVQHAARALDKWTDFVFHDFNGRWERAVHTGMAGKVARDNPLMTRKLKNAAEAMMKQMSAKDGIADSEFMNYTIAFGREMHKMFGKYGGFSPGLRRLIATWMPFVAWTINSFNFLLYYLPKDHPLFTALAADASVASQEWRGQKGLVAPWAQGAVPWWLQGSVPVGSGKLRLAQMTPTAIASDPTQMITGTFNPIGESVMNVLQGKDWKGKDLPSDQKNNPYIKTVLAMLTLVEATVPLTGQAVQAIQGKSVKQIQFPYNIVKKPKSKKGSSFYETTPSDSGGSYYEPKSSGSSGSYYEP